MGRETNPEASLIALWSLTHFLKNTAIACPRAFLHFVSWQFLYSQTHSVTVELLDLALILWG